MDRPDGMDFEEYRIKRNRANKGLKQYQKGKYIWKSDFIESEMRIKRTYKKSQYGKIGSGD